MGANVQSLVNESNEATPTSGQILKWNDVQINSNYIIQQLYHYSMILQIKISLTPGNSVDLSSLLLSGTTGVSSGPLTSVSATKLHSS